jgi:amino-acid N-acetyltransferase
MPHSQVLACALLHELGASADGVQCGELAAFCVHPSYRGAGRGDSLLDYVEQQARDKGIRRMVPPPASGLPCQILRMQIKM